ncbi:MAG: LamG-like jellyroll fold domain-containing protein, partial [Nanoarchaeota archaeon]
PDNVTFYINGTAQATTFSADRDFTNASYSSANLHVGSGFAGDTPFNGSIDEVRIWKRALTSEEISAEYNRTASNYLVSHNFSGPTHLFSINLTNLTNGNYSWFAWLNDSSGQANATTSAVATSAVGQREFKVDLIPPAISLIANTPANQSVLSNNYIFVNTSENDAGNNHNELSAFIDFNNSLVGYWRFEDDGDTNASDFTGYNNNGTLTSMGCTAADCAANSGFTSGGKRGKGMVFDGVDDYVNVPSSANLNITGNLTVVAWVYPLLPMTESSTVNRIIVEKGVDTSGSGSNAYSMLTEMTAASGTTLSRFIFSIVNATGNPSAQFSIDNSYANRWVHLVGTYNSTHVVLYVDGILRVNASAGGTINTTADALRMGWNGGSANLRMFNGSIDEVQVWSRALDAQEVNASFQAGVYRLFRNFTGLNDGNYSYRAYVVDA